MFQHSPPLVQPLVNMTFVLQDGRSPLLIASSEGHLDIVKTFIEAGANVNEVNKVRIYDLIIFEHTYCTYCSGGSREEEGGEERS